MGVASQRTAGGRIEDLRRDTQASGGTTTESEGMETRSKR